MRYHYSEAKNQQLQAERGISFEDVIAVIDRNDALDVVDHPNQKKYPNQKVYIVSINDYIYLVPFVRVDENSIFLKTIFASRKTKKFYMNKLKNEVPHEKTLD